MLREVTYALASGVVIVIGFLCSFALMFNNNVLMTIGRQIAASPIPLPFGDVLGFQQNFSYDIGYRVYLEDGSIKDIAVKDLVLDGPHKRKIVYVSLFTHSLKNSRYEVSPLMNVFCSEDAPLLRANGIEGRVQVVDVRMRSRDPIVTESWNVHISCIS